jgi:hypothetical protein
MNRSLGLTALFAAVLLVPTSAQEKSADAPFRIVKYDGLGKEVMKHRGKVVLVDVWADF